MNSDIKQKWLQALRSGDYKQTTGYLGRIVLGEIGHCCLGVLCEVMDEPKTDAFGGYTMYGQYDLRMISPEARRKADIPSDKLTKLTHLNDCARLSFSEIADWIEANL